MRQFLDKTTQKFKKKAGQAVDLLKPSSRYSRSTSRASSQQREAHTSPGPEVMSTPIPVATEPSHLAGTAVADAASPSDIPTYAEAPDAPTVLATTGSAVKTLLIAARDGSDLFPPLKAALVGIVALWDVFNRTAEAKVEFAKLESKLKAINTIATMDRDKVDPSLQARLEVIVQAIKGLWEAVEQRQARGGVVRVMQSTIDLGDIKALNNAISSLMELFQFEGGIALQKELGELTFIAKRLDASEIERQERQRIKQQEKAMKTIKSVLGDNLGLGAADHEQPNYAGCMIGTRESVLLKFVTWVKEDPMAIFWLAGMAGTGKTSIAVSLCRMLRDDPAVLLGGGYFCSRSAGLAVRTDVRNILPTLAALLAAKSQEFAASLAVELDKDQHLCHKPVGEQLNALLHSPLAAISPSTRPIVFVIDALDECKDENELGELLRLLADLPCNGKLKFILTSRPELHIRGTPISNSVHSTILQLHTLDIEEVTSDIRHYIRSTLHGAAPDATWYTNQDVELLVMLSGGLFIFASTVLKYVLQRKEEDDRRDRLRKATSAVATRTAATSALDEVYKFVLVDASRSDSVDEDELERTRSILACILTARTPLSVGALAALMGMTAGRLRGALERLHSLVYLPSDDRQRGLQTLHASFGDYLLGRAPADIQIVPALGHDLLAHGCLDRMALDDLCFDIARTRWSFRRNPKGTPHWIELSLVYACLNWAYHIAAASDPSAFSAGVGHIFRIKFLFWLEVLSVLGKTGLASRLLRIADMALSQTDRFQCNKLTLQKVNDPIVSQFLRDADVFVASSHEAISRSAPHIYLSALPFAAKDSLVYRDFAPLCSGVVSVTTSGIDRHGGRLVTTLTGHDRGVRSIAYSPDGCHLASGSEDGTARIWDTRTGAETMKLSHSGGSVSSVAFSPKGQCVVSGTLNGVVHVWSVSTGRAALHPLHGHVGAVMSVAYSPDGTLIASSSTDKTARIWSAETGREIFILSGHTDVVNAIAFSADGRLLAWASNDKTICLWAPYSGNAVESPLTDLGQIVQCLGFSPNGKWLAAGFSRMVRTWDVATQQPNPVTIYCHTGVASLAFSSNGSMLITSGRSTIQCWDTQSGRELHSTSFAGHSDWVFSLAFSIDGKHLASGSADRTIRIWNLVGGEETVIQSLRGHSGTVSSVEVTPDGTCIISGSYDGSIRVWDTHTGQGRSHPLLGHTDAVTNLDVSPLGNFVASASRDSTVRLWNTHTGELIGEPMLGHQHSVCAVAFSPDTRWLATGSRDKVVHVWDVATRALAAFSPLQCMAEVFAVAFSPDCRLLGAADSQGYVHFWRSGTNQLARTSFRTSSHSLNCLVFSSDSTKAVAGGFDNAIWIWNIADGHQVALLTGHLNAVCSVRYSPDGRYIVSASDDKTVRIWSTQTSEAVAILSGHGDMVESATFTPDGRSIVSGSADATLHVWNVEAAITMASRAEQCPLTRLGLAKIADDGWLVGPAGELLLWVPAQYCGHIALPPCTMIIGSYRIDLTIRGNGGNLHWGDQWKECWHGLAQPTVRPSS